jgi:hypothetical protein
MFRRILILGTFLLLVLLVTVLSVGAHGSAPVTTDPETGAAHFSDVGLAAASSQSSGAQQGKHRNLSEIGSLSFPDGANTDVWAHGNYAYVGTFSSGTSGFCPETGVKIVDVSDPTNPTFVGNLASPSLTRANDVKVANINTHAFHGDLLVHSNEPCVGGGDGGVVLYDVSDPTNPVRLGAAYDINDLFNGPNFTAFGVHNAWIFEQGNKAYLGVVANISPSSYDFRILDISDPTAAIQVGRWSSTVSPDAPPAETRGTSRSLGLHDVTVNGNGTVAYLSYWDAGYILLDVSDPANPTFMGVNPWEPGDEGNAHAAWPARGGNLMVTSDEDFSPNGLASATTSVALGSFGIEHEAAEASFTPSLSGPFGPHDVAWVGLGAGINTAQAFGCAADPGNPNTSGPAVPYGEAVSGKIALIQRGACRFDEKLAVAESEGAIGAIVFNDAREDLVTMGGNPIVNIPGIFIRGSRGNELAALRELGTTVQATMAPGQFNGFGFLRVFDTSDPANIVELSEIKLPSTNDPNAPPFGSHNVMVRGNTVYVSWYTDGLVVVDISDPANPQVLAQAVDPTDNYWGVYVQGDLIFTSDRANGLVIYKHVPASEEP